MTSDFGIHRIFDGIVPRSTRAGEEDNDDAIRDFQLYESGRVQREHWETITNGFALVSFTSESVALLARESRLRKNFLRRLPILIPTFRFCLCSDWPKQFQNLLRPYELSNHIFVDSQSK